MRAAVTTRSRDLRRALLQRARRARAAKPAQRRGIPIWIGGHTDAACAARPRSATPGTRSRCATGAALPDEYAKRAKELRAWAQQAGRDPKSVTPHRCACRWRCAPGTPSRPPRAPLFQGTAAEVIADIRAYQAVGVTPLRLRPTVPDLKATLTNMDALRPDVRARS